MSSEADVGNTTHHQDARSADWTPPKGTVEAGVIALVIGLAVGYYAQSANLSRISQQSADRGHKVGILTQQVGIKLGEPVDLDVGRINRDLRQYEVTSRELGQDPRTLERNGIETKDMRDQKSEVARREFMSRQGKK